MGETDQLSIVPSASSSNFSVSLPRIAGRSSQECSIFLESVFHVTLATKTIRQSGGTFGYHHYPYHLGYAPTYDYSFQEGTLVLDIVSQDGKALLWRGWVSGAVPTPDTAGNRVALAVREILNRFPEAASSQP